jgi:hypothetical protein
VTYAELLRRRHTPDSLQRQTPKDVAELEHGLEHNDDICLRFFFFTGDTHAELLRCRHALHAPARAHDHALT